MFNNVAVFGPARHIVNCLCGCSITSHDVFARHAPVFTLRCPICVIEYDYKTYKDTGILKVVGV